MRGSSKSRFQALLDLVKHILSGLVGWIDFQHLLIPLLGVREILQLMRDRKFTFQATVEFEYPIPEGSTRMAEIAKALDYCRTCLLS